MNKESSLTLMRYITLAAALIGAAFSLSFSIHAGRNNNSAVLIMLFIVWDLSPFAGLFIANLRSGSWPEFKQMLLNILILIITALSLLSYSGILRISGTKPAFSFLVVPLASWLLFAAVMLIPSTQSRSLT